MSSLPNSHVITYREIAAELIATPFRALVSKLAAAAERDPRMIAVSRITAMSDAELAAKGTTRADAVRHALGAYF